MEDGPTFRSTGGSSEPTVAGGTESFGSEQKRKVGFIMRLGLGQVQSRHLDRLHKLKAHHDSCENRNKKAKTKRLKDERERTLFLYNKLKTTVNRKMLGYTTEESLSSPDASEDEYVPQSVGQTESDSSAEEKQHKGKKRKVQHTTSANSQGADVQPRKKRCMAPSCSLAANDKESPSAESSDVALNTLQKWNVPQLLPFAEDVRKMHQFLSVQRTECHRKLEEEPGKKPWAELAEMTLCEVILFNRRREGEVSKMLLSAFMLRDSSSTHPDVELALSDLEKKLCKHFERIEIRDKRGRKVPILLTPDMLASMELLVKTRGICDVSDDNQFMFGRPQALTHFRGSDVIRQVARSCGANHPEALSSAKLRKHMATMSKVLNLKDNEMDDLADFLGHDIRVHGQYYRLPEGTLQLAKISKVLMALERGQLSEFKGRTLDEINIDPEEKVAVDSETSDTEDEDAAPSSSQSSDASGVVKKSTTDEILDNDLHPAQGSSKSKKRKWGDEEIQAVESTLLDCIRSGKVPGKAECLKCIETSPVALRGRRWEGVKFYVKNRIDALRRDSVKEKR